VKCKAYFTGATFRFSAYSTLQAPSPTLPAFRLSARNNTAYRWFMILQAEQSDEIVRRLKDELSPEEIYLFGSQAKGTAVDGRSDVDLCVVVADDSEPSHRKAVRAYRSLRGLGLPKDIIVRHRSSFTERAQWASAVEHEVAQHGRCIYQK